MRIRTLPNGGTFSQDATDSQNQKTISFLLVPKQQPPKSTKQPTLGSRHPPHSCSTPNCGGCRWPSGASGLSFVCVPTLFGIRNRRTFTDKINKCCAELCFRCTSHCFRCLVLFSGGRDFFGVVGARN